MDIAQPGNSRGNRLIAGLVALPLLFGAYIILHYGINVPRWDEWAIAPLINDYDAGRLSLKSLFQQQNDSRLFFPKLLYLPIALVSAWDTRYLMWVTLGLMALSLIMMVRIALKQHHGLQQQPSREMSIHTAASIFMAGAIICTPFQTALPWGYIFPVHIPFACLITAIAIGEARNPSWVKHVVGIVLAVVATFSYANGMALWVLLVGYHALSRRYAGRGLWWLAAWLVSAALSFWLYFHDYRFLAKTQFSEPLKAIKGLLCFLGAPLSPPAPKPPAELAVAWGTVVGTAVVLVCLVMAWRFLIAEPERRRCGLPWLLVMAFTFVSGAVATVGRIASGEFALMATRYASFNTYLLASICLVAGIAFYGGGKARLARWSVLLVIAALWAITFPMHMQRMEEFIGTVRADARMLRYAEQSPRPPTLLALFPNQRLYDYSRAVRKSGRLMPPAPTEAEYGAGLNRGSGGFVEVVAPTHVAGWAAIPGSNPRPAGVVLTEIDASNHRRVIAIARCDMDRPDVKQHLSADESRFGWQIGVRTKPGAKLQVFAVDTHSRKLYALQAAP